MLPSSKALSQRLKWLYNEWQQHFTWKKVIKTKLVKHFYQEKEMRACQQSRYNSNRRVSLQAPAAGGGVDAHDEADWRKETS